MRWNLEGRVAVVTGGAAGIGRATAQQLAARGARVAVLDRDASGAEIVAKGLGTRAAAFEVDIADRESVERAVGAVRDHFGSIDILVANAGIAGPTQPMLSVDQDEFERVLEINLIGTWRTVKAALADVVRSNGYVVATSSMAAGLPGPGMAAYAMSKVAIDAMGRALRIELATSGTDVGVAYFGLVATDLIAGLGEAPGLTEVMAAFPGPMSKPIEAHRAARAIVDGIERRRAQVYAPGWVRGLLGFRGQLTLVDRYVSRVPAIAAVLERR